MIKTTQNGTNGDIFIIIKSIFINYYMDILFLDGYIQTYEITLEISEMTHT